MKQQELILSKWSGKVSFRTFWHLKQPAKLLEMLLATATEDKSFRTSIEFSKLDDKIVAVFGIDKSAVDTGCALRLANRKGGNSSDFTQLLAAYENAAKSYQNFERTFFHPLCPIGKFLQSGINDEYQMIVLKIGRAQKYDADVLHTNLPLSFLRPLFSTSTIDLFTLVQIIRTKGGYLRSVRLLST
jgi:hypothetical protein